MLGTFDLTTTISSLYAKDTDADGTAEVLYVQSWTEDIFYVCDPAGATPFAATLLDWGAGTSNYGMGYDRVTNTLWVFDDDLDEFMSVR